MSSVVEQVTRKLVRRRNDILHLWQESSRGEQEALEVRSSDWPDLAAEREAAEVLGKLSERERAELNEIDAALARAKNHELGKCVRCGEPIERKRLLAVPQTAYCIECAATERA